MEPGRGGVREPQSSTIPTPRFNQSVGTLNPFSHIGGTHSLNGMVDNPRSPYLGNASWKIPALIGISELESELQTEVCAKSTVPYITMHWIKEVEIAKSIDDPMTSRSVTGRTDFTDYDMLGVMVASALKKLLTKCAFQLKDWCRRAACSKIRQISFDGGKLHTRSLSTCEPPKQLKLHKVYQFCSIYTYKGWRSIKYSIQGVTKVNEPQVKFLRKWSWTVYTSQSCRILFSFRLYGLCMLRGKWENAISGKQLDNDRQETHAVSVMIPHGDRCAGEEKKKRFFCTNSEGTEWRKDTLQRFRPQRRKPFWKRRWFGTVR